MPTPNYSRMRLLARMRTREAMRTRTAFMLTMVGIERRVKRRVARILSHPTKLGDWVDRAEEGDPMAWDKIMRLADLVGVTTDDNLRAPGWRGTADEILRVAAAKGYYRGHRSTGDGDGCRGK
jgi:hypothetical protein